MLKKIKFVFLFSKAEREFFQFDKKIQHQFLNLITELEFEGKLKFPKARKINDHPNLYEMRASVNRQIYRAIYSDVGKNRIMIFHVFQKKTQKIPKKYINLAKKRYYKYEREKKV